MDCLEVLHHILHIMVCFDQSIGQYVFCIPDVFGGDVDDYLACHQ